MGSFSIPVYETWQVSEHLSGSSLTDKFLRFSLTVLARPLYPASSFYAGEFKKDLSLLGMPLYEINLPSPKSPSVYWNGALAAPTLANIDSDPNLEIVVNTVYAGFVAYEIPDSANARILWHTGRAGQTYQARESYLLWTK